MGFSADVLSVHPCSVVDLAMCDGPLLATYQALSEALVTGDERQLGHYCGFPLLI